MNCGFLLKNNSQNAYPAADACFLAFGLIFSLRKPNSYFFGSEEPHSTLKTWISDIKCTLMEKITKNEQLKRQPL